MIEHFTNLTIIALSVFALLYIWMTYLFLEYKAALKNAKASDAYYSSLENDWLKVALSKKLNFIDALKLIKHNSKQRNIPWLHVVDSMTEVHMNNTHDSEKLMRTLQQNIQQFYRHLSKPVSILKNVAPVSGMLFTVLGLIVVLVAQAKNPNPNNMFGDMSVAFITTALGCGIFLPCIFLTFLIDQLKNKNFIKGKNLIYLFLNNKQKIDNNYMQQRGGNHAKLG